MTHSVRIIRPSYPLYAYENDLLTREIGALAPDSKFEADGASVRTSNSKDLVRLAFAHGIETDGDVLDTWQKHAEASGPSARAKNSTYGPHGIHRYKGKFYPQLAKSLINSSDGRGTILDPFGGSGTVAAEAVMAGRRAISFDCNPVAVAIARAKVTVLTAAPSTIRDYLQRTSLASERLGPEDGEAGIDQFPTEVLNELQSWFAPRVLARLNPLLRLIRSEPDPSLANIGLVLVSDLIREVSQQEPKDLRIRRRAIAIDDAPVVEIFRRKLFRLASKLDLFWLHTDGQLPASGSAKVVLDDSGDSSAFAKGVSEELSCVVSSPPYGTALPYIDTDRLSLAAVFSFTTSDRRGFERQMIGSRDISKPDWREIEERVRRSPDELGLPDSTITFLQSYLEAVSRDDSAGFRKLQAPSVLARYFVSMSDVFQNFVPRLAKGADVWMVLGDSRSKISDHWWVIPTVDEIAAIGKRAGLDLHESIPISVTREDVLHSRNTITKNQILHFRS